MARRNRHTRDMLSQVLERVRRRLDQTPLSRVGTILLDVLGEVQFGLQNGQVSQEQANQVAEYFERVIKHLPQSFGDRFRFDAAMIVAFAEEWTGGSTQCSGMVLPRPAAEWGHQSVIILPDRQAPRVIDLILIPGDDNLDDIDLLSYPFLGHELGHNALFKDETDFAQDFEKELEEHINSLRRQSLADKGPAQAKAKEVIDQVLKVWTPTPNHFNWAHEIAVDFIALWTCGPAYLAAFTDVLDDPQIDPYQVGQSHPPYEVRARALIRAANRLAWAAQAQRLMDALQTWAHSDWRHGKNNLYAALATPAVINVCVDRAVKACEVLGLPKCTPETVNSLHEKLNCGERPDLGSELVLAAWLVRENTDEATYEKWEREAIRAHLRDITL